jgi:hypothetical protein
VKPLTQNLSTGKYCLNTITVKEICDKYPDKIMDTVMDKHGVTHLVMDTCTILFNSKFKRVSSDIRLSKQIRNNKHN